MNRILLSAVAVLMSGAAAMAEYPDRPISFLVPWNAGGGTDAIARTFAAGLEKELGAKITVINRTGGAGVVGHQAMVTAEPDGYTIGLGTAELVSFYWNGQADFTYEAYTPISLINLDPAAFHVAADSEWKDLRQALDAIKAAPAGTYKIAGMAPGAAYHIALSELLQKEGIDPVNITVIPTQGAAPGFQELVSGGVEILPFSLPEGRTMLEAGKTRVLATFDAGRSAAFPDVPTLKEAIDLDYVNGTWRGIVAPAGLPADVQARLSQASQKVVESEEFKAFMEKQGYGISYKNAEEFTAFLKEKQASVGEVLGLLKLRVRD